MADRKNNNLISSESLIAVIIVIGLAVMMGYYIYQEEATVFKIPERKLPKKKEVKEDKPTKPPPIMPSSLTELLPSSKSGNEIIHHFAYSLSYDDEAEQAEWLAYKLTDKYVSGKERRSDNFKEDPLIESGSASNKDYYRNGYDKGHLAPAADFKWSKQAMNESFYLSNMSPQVAAFNRGVWLDLEEQVRDWATFEKTLFIVVGAVLTDDLPVIGENEVAVPKYFYKVILDVSKPEYKSIAFMFRNEKSKNPIASFAVSVDSVESFTGINFFPEIPDELEHVIEKQSDFNEWPIQE